MNLNSLRLFNGFGLAIVFMVAIFVFHIRDARAEVIETNKDQNFANMLASLEFLGEIRLRSGLQVRIFRSSDSGECDSGTEAKSCPKSQLYFVRSLVTEGPTNSTLWNSARLIQWKLVGKLSEETVNFQNKQEESFGVVTFELTACRAPENVESGKVDPRKGGWWFVTRYGVRVTNDGMTVTEIPSKIKPEVCELY